MEELKDDAAGIATGVYPGLLGVKEIMGERGEKREMGNPLPPLNPLFLLPTTRVELGKLKFYPLEPNLPSIVQLFLRAKEANFLLYKLQKSLDFKMDNEHTKPSGLRWSANMKTDKQNDSDFQKYLQSLGLKRLENGKMINVNEENKRG